MRKLSVRQLAEAYYDAASTVHAGEQASVATAFLQLLSRQHMLRKLPRIFAELDRLTTERGGPEIVQVRTAEHVDAETDATLTKHLEHALGRSVKLRHVHEAKILAGAKIQVGDRLIDNTLAGRLAALKAHLLNS